MAQEQNTQAQTQGQQPAPEQGQQQQISKADVVQVLTQIGNVFIQMVKTGALTEQSAKEVDMIMPHIQNMIKYEKQGGEENPPQQGGEEPAPTMTV